MLKFRKAPAVRIGSEVVVKCQYRRYYGVVLRINIADAKAEVCLWDDILSEWRPLWFPLWRIRGYNEKAAALAATA